MILLPKQRLNTESLTSLPCVKIMTKMMILTAQESFATLLDLIVTMTNKRQQA